MKTLHIGDIVAAKDNTYAVTNKRAGWVGIVTEIIMQNHEGALFGAKTISPLASFGEQYYGLDLELFNVIYSNTSDFNIGDVVHVKGLAGIAQSCIAQSCKDGQKRGQEYYYLGHDGIYFSKEMRILCGRTCVIKGTLVTGSGVKAYKLTDELSGMEFPYNYTPWMFTKEEEQDD